MGSDVGRLGLAFGWLRVGLPARIRFWLGLTRGMDTPDRRVLEDQILGGLARRWRLQPGPRPRVLFVGCDWYTAHYPSLWPEAEFTTIEPDPSKARHGAQRHIVDVLQHLGRHVEPWSFDVIVCNGVYGWGLDDAQDVETAFQACIDALDHDGVLVLGWNDVPRRDPVPLRLVKALDALEPWSLPGVGQRIEVAASAARHTYVLMRQPVSRATQDDVGAT
ncbi:MAG: Methyltransferase type 11 [Rhizobacter sp.]|nr:Methyltransferase type 11 [Rhizobacter sp.]